MPSGQRRDRAGPARSTPLHVRILDALRRPGRSIALVTGCPRSGTTAVIEWLAAQPDVAAFNESRVLLAAHRFLDEVDRFEVLSRRSSSLALGMRAAVLDHYRAVARRSGRLIIEKEPLEPIALPDGDFGRFLRHVRALFPDCKLLYLVRHPVPTVWSMMNRKWGYSLTSGAVRSFTVAECLATWKANATLAAELRSDPAVRVSRFEDLASDPEAESRAILEFLGIRDGASFTPRPTAEVGFEPEQCERILQDTAPERALFGY